MRQWLRSNLTYANVMATLAVFLVLGGGTAIASLIITDNSQVASNTISGHKPPTGKHANLFVGSVNGQDVADNTLGGADINESTLATVPSAANGARKFVYDQPVQLGVPMVTPILTLKEMTLKAACQLPSLSSQTYVYFRVASTVDAGINYFYLDGEEDNTPTPVAKGTVIPAGGVVVPVQGQPSIGGTFRRFEGQLVYQNATRVITVTFHVIANDDTERCQVDGTAVQAPS
jgi:hypothetical protein